MTSQLVLPLDPALLGPVREAVRSVARSARRHSPEGYLQQLDMLARLEEARDLRTPFEVAVAEKLAAAKRRNQRNIPTQAITVRRLKHLTIISNDDGPLPPRPRTRAECVDGPRPCGFISCRLHLFLEVNEKSGTVRLNFPELLTPDGPDLERMAETCALDVADRGGIGAAEIGDLLNMSREAARIIELRALAKLKEELVYEDSDLYE